VTGSLKIDTVRPIVGVVRCVDYSQLTPKVHRTYASGDGYAQPAPLRGLRRAFPRKNSPLKRARSLIYLWDRRGRTKPNRDRAKRDYRSAWLRSPRPINPNRLSRRWVRPLAPRFGGSDWCARPYSYWRRLPSIPNSHRISGRCQCPARAGEGQRLA
jgi:hypothetical protein